MNKINENGRSMIEMLGVLAIIGVLSVGGIMGYSKAMFRYKINKTIEQITYIAGNVRTAFANQGNYEGLDGVYRNGQWDRSLLKKAHIFPDDMWKDGEDWPQNVWGERVTVTYYEKGDNDRNKAFAIIAGTNDESVCIELATHNWSNIGCNILEIDGEYENGWEMYYIPPIDLNTAVEICKKRAHESQYKRFFYFLIDVDSNSERWQERLQCGSISAGGC